MAAIWTDEAKFAAWREVELAVLKAREQFGQIPNGTYEYCREGTHMDPAAAGLIARRDGWIKHDLNAFLDVMRLQLSFGTHLPGVIHAAAAEELTVRMAVQRGESTEDPDAKFHDVLDHALLEVTDARMSAFHDGMTSYDTEEPAMALLLTRASEIIADGLHDLETELRIRALRHQGLVMMGRTHGQHAQPITFGAKCLNWLEMVQRAGQRLTRSAEEVMVMKLSGAVGMYGTLPPAVEEAVARELTLEVAPVATQIVALDRRAQLVATLAEIAAVVEKVSRDLWLLAQSEMGEIREPFSKKQKGSSAMPHKKNPITLEQLFGLPRLIRGYASALLENVATANERDISHSSVERIALPDAFGLTDHMLRRLIAVVAGMEVDGERMYENLERSYGTFASQRVEMYLKAHGMSAEQAYRLVQDLSAIAMRDRTHLCTRLLGGSVEHPALADETAIKALFDPVSWVRDEPALYARMGLEYTPDPSLRDGRG